MKINTKKNAKANSSMYKRIKGYFNKQHCKLTFKYIQTYIQCCPIGWVAEYTDCTSAEW